MCNYIELGFDSFCRKALRNRLIDFRRSEAYHREWEVRLEGDLLNQLYQNDEYFTNEVQMGDYVLEIKDYDLYSLILSLDEQERFIILLKYFFGSSDLEIARQVHIPRRTIAYKRNRIIEKLRIRGEKLGQV